MRDDGTLLHLQTQDALRLYIFVPTVQIHKSKLYNFDEDEWASVELN